MKTKLIRTSTVAMSLNFLLKGQLAFLNEYYNVVAVSGQDADFEEVAKRERVVTISIKMERNISPLKDFVSLVRLYVFFKKEKPDIIHSITPKAGLLTMLAGYLSGVPIRIHTFTGLIFPSKTGILQKILVLMDRLLCLCATHIYPEGEGVKKDLLNYRITNKPLKILANGNVNGIDTAHFSLEQISLDRKKTLKQQLAIHSEDFVFIFVGRLVSDKGINELILAFSKITDPKVKLLLVGPFEPKLDPLNEETTEEIEKNPKILSVGFQKDVRPYFAIANALVFPSYREGFPNVVMQAGAMGLPAIVSNINGCNEIIVEGENGIIIPPKDANSLHTAMLKFVQDRELLDQLRINSRRMVVERYEQKVVWDALLAEYKSLEGNV